MFFGGIKEDVYLLKDMRRAGLDQVFACGDGAGASGASSSRRKAQRQRGGGACPLGRARPRQGSGLSGITERYTGRFGPINNCASSSYDSAPCRGVLNRGRGERRRTNSLIARMCSPLSRRSSFKASPMPRSKRSTRRATTGRPGDLRQRRRRIDASARSNQIRRR